MKRVIIIGSGGAGKSTLAKQMAGILDLPVFHLDSLFWKPNWQKTPKPDFDKQLIELMNQQHWILDGNYSRTIELRMQYADTVIFLNFNRFLCLWRAFLRTYLAKRVDPIPGCKPQMDMEFVKWIWSYSRNRVPKVLEILNRYKDSKKIFILKNPKEKQQFLQVIEQKYA